jgi:hypothetical protein
MLEMQLEKVKNLNGNNMKRQTTKLNDGSTIYRRGNQYWHRVPKCGTIRISETDYNLLKRIHKRIDK